MRAKTHSPQPFFSLFPGKIVDSQRGWIEGYRILHQGILYKVGPDSRLDDLFGDDASTCDNGDRVREVHHLIIRVEGQSPDTYNV